MFDLEIKTTPNAVARVILAHGAGAGKEHDFMQALATQLVTQQLEVVLFNFPYMQQSNALGKKRPPDRMAVLTEHFEQLVTHVETTLTTLPLFIAGKSMGGRVATMIGNTSRCRGVIVYGYPFHPPGKPDKTRLEHLQATKVPVCIIQGDRDAFGRRDEVDSYSLGPAVTCHYLRDGDHSFKPRKASGLEQQQHIIEAARITRGFIDLCNGKVNE